MHRESSTIPDLMTVTLVDGYKAEIQSAKSWLAIQDNCGDVGKDENWGSALEEDLSQFYTSYSL